MADILGGGAEGSWGDEGWLSSAPVCTIEERRSSEVPNGACLIEEALQRWQRMGEAVLPSYQQTVSVQGKEGAEYIARRALAIARSSNTLARKTRTRGRLPALQNVALQVGLPRQE